MPIYRHPELHPIGEERGTYDDLDDGSISDGDDIAWLGDKAVLSSGQWRDVARGSLLGKRAREDDLGRRHSDGDSSQVPRLAGQGDAPAAFGEAYSEDVQDEEVRFFFCGKTKVNNNVT